MTIEDNKYFGSTFIQKLALKLQIKLPNKDILATSWHIINRCFCSYLSYKINILCLKNPMKKEEIFSN